MIDLRSDTVTLPTEDMRKAMYNAKVGDDVYEEDPTVNALEELAAQMVGKEKALFLPTGTMGNQVAILTHTNRGDEIITEERAHIFFYEVGGTAVLSGVQIRTIKGNDFGVMDPKDVKDAIRIENIHFPTTKLICLENTFNRAGGTVLPMDNLKDIRKIAQESNVKIHMDGARLFNASVYLGIDVKEITKEVDTVQFCLSKGLCAPVGCMLAGDKEFIIKARKYRKMLGGGMRQGGILASAGIIALEKMVDRLIIDHEVAKELAIGLSAIKGININMESVQTNILIFKIEGFDSGTFISELKKRGILANATTPSSIRFVTHKDINKDDAPYVLDTVKGIMNKT
jgi:threonine aldolase